MKNFEQHPSPDSGRSQAEFEARLRNIRPRAVQFDVEDILTSQTTPIAGRMPAGRTLQSSWQMMAVAWGIGMVMGGCLMWLLNDYWLVKPIDRLVSQQSESMAEVPSQRSNGEEAVAALKEKEASDINQPQPRLVNPANPNINSRMILDEPFVLSSYDDLAGGTRSISAYYALRPGRQSGIGTLSAARTNPRHHTGLNELPSGSRSRTGVGSEYRFEVNLPSPTPMVNVQELTRKLLSETL